jgi:hypothetical protein
VFAGHSPRVTFSTGGGARDKNRDFPKHFKTLLPAKNVNNRFQTLIRFLGHGKSGRKTLQGVDWVKKRRNGSDNLSESPM